MRRASRSRERSKNSAGRNGSGSAWRTTARAFPEHDLQKIFLPFYTTKSEGTGLGLAVVQKVALQHGGSIEARNRPAAGPNSCCGYLCGRRIHRPYSPHRQHASKLVLGTVLTGVPGGVAMRRILSWAAAAAILAIPASGWCQGADPKPSQENQSQTPAQSNAAATAGTTSSTARP